MYCVCIHMYPSCLNIINQFDGYRSSSIRKQQKIALFCQNQKESEESTKKAKTFMFVALFLLASKSTHTQLWLFHGKLLQYFECRCICTVIPSFIGIFSSLTFILAFTATFVFWPHFSWLIFVVKCFLKTTVARVDLLVCIFRVFDSPAGRYRPSIFLGTTPYCLRINCKRFTTRIHF